MTLDTSINRGTDTRVPSFGVGTFRLKGQVAIDSVTQAPQLG